MPKKSESKQSKTKSAKQPKKVKELPKTQTVILTYLEKGVPLYKITTTRQRDVYYLYSVDEDSFTFLKQRKNDPLFPECGY